MSLKSNDVLFGYHFMYAVSAKFVYNTDLDVFNNPNEETERFIDGVSLFFDCIGKISVELPLYKIFPNKLYRDVKKSLTVINIISIIQLPKKKIASGCAF